MTLTRNRNQFGDPFLLQSFSDGAAAAPLVRMRFGKEAGVGETDYDESWLQEFIHRFPRALPILEIDSGLTGVVSLGREIPTPKGYIDNLYVNSSGDLVLIECKLWRNQQARREVLSQIIEYAQAMTGWSYSHLDAAVQRGLRDKTEPLGASIVDRLKSQDSMAAEELVEADFVDAVERNLRRGRFLLLVVGDGVREGAAELAEYLQQHAGFHFTLGLIEVALWRLPMGGILVQPRLLIRTHSIERAIIRLDGDGLRAEPVISHEKAVPLGAQTSMSAEDFRERLRAERPDVAKALDAFLAATADIGVYLVRATKSGSLKLDLDEDTTLYLGGIKPDGGLVTNSVVWSLAKFGKQEVAHRYLRALATLCGGSVRETPDAGQWYVVASGTTAPDSMRLLASPEGWRHAVEDYIAAAREALANGTQ